MTLFAAISADFNASPIGTRSRLHEPVAGTPVLRRTVERALQINALDGVAVLVSPGDAPAARSLLDGLNVRIETHQAPPAGYRELVRAGRVWGLDGWRGGLGSLCVFDEDFNTALLHGLAHQVQAHALLCIPAASPLLDADLLSEMVAHYHQHVESARMTIVQAPPGLAGFIIARDILDQLLSVAMPPGALLIYQP